MRTFGGGHGRLAGILLASLLAAVTACSSEPSSSRATANKTPAPPPPPPARIAITPDDGAKKARPEEGVTVKATGGQLQTVTVLAGDKQVEGEFNADHTEWKTSRPLKPSTSYEVSGTARNPAGQVAQATGKFRTLKPVDTITASLDWILEGNQGDTYGVGLPIIVNFDREVYNKEQVERALEVQADKPVPGAWRWVGNQQVIYRTEDYWPAHQKVKLIAHMTGVRAAKDVYGTKDLTRTFEIGAERIATVDLKKHKMTVKVDGEKVRTVPVSGGNGSTLEYTTTSGTHLTMEKDNPTRMISPNRKKGDPGYYDLLINYAVRISWSGEYLHQTAGEEYCLGRDNCSHGCVRQPVKDAIWFYKNVQPADVVIVKGTRRGLDPMNGWSFYEMSWKEWKKGSALD